MKIKNNCTLVIAGPGSGKTFNMVQKALECLPELQPHRFMALITYTNAATEKIKEKLQAATKMPPNIFVGTIHGFMNRFILKPYGSLFDLLPKDYFIVDSIDFSFLDGPEFRTKLKTNIDRQIYEKAIENKKFLKGVVTYNQIESKTAKLLEEEKATVRRALGNRLQFLFIDEIQDATSTQYRIFENLRIQGETKIYCIGDPEQYIYGFTYIEKKQKPPVFSNIPIKKLQSNRQVIQSSIAGVDEEENRRSTPKIVKFLNNFRIPGQKEVTQICKDNADIIFITKTDIREIVRIFDNLCDNLLSPQIKDDGEFCKFFLSYANDTFGPVYATCGMEKISNDHVSPKSVLKMALDYILAVSGRTQTDILEECNIPLIDFRRIGMSTLHQIRKESQLNESVIREYLKDMLPIRFNCENQKTRNSFENLVSNFQTFGSSSNKNSSIHKAKGLEASAVLALAETENRLSKWLETNHDERAKDKTDECRLGFVAFSRAKHFLSIACLQPVDKDVLDRMKDLDVVIV